MEKINIFSEEDIPFLLNWIEALKEERDNLKKALVMFEELYQLDL